MLLNKTKSNYLLKYNTNIREKIRDIKKTFEKNKLIHQNLSVNYFFNKKEKKLIEYKIIIHLANKNVIFIITDKNSKIINYITSGLLGYKGFQKRSKDAVIILLKKIFFFFNYINNKNTSIYIKGLKYNRKLIIKKLKKKFIVKSLIYNDILPHNGCRPKKKKRI
uniref:Ribosomal protein S11 n=1 Tax=Sundstroemia setigera TaxID=3005 RepID=A0A8A6KEQ2_9STRA|nr:ribosomal protein S11 [Rhizosolenia setigera]QTI82383.1 ribosomal protein S11 [Rhizosolenia setigera]WAQ69946.1 ribosomal protein S11 [Rhizosolenia setigera]WAQ69982.1 ribosomal protein S11 [Rhizosolenia setigera]WAQ70018.1 ribosomal protein S11 [Rhizosolenia setigera]WAQ70054.1 ribosomal protein S11 [Rhizosolenia setigera]